MASEVLNLEKHNFYTQKSLGLNNYWLFYPNELLTGPEIKSFKNLKGIPIRINHNWHKLNKEGLSINKKGYATYYTQIKVSHDVPKLGILIPELNTSAKVFINNRLVEEIGRVSMNEGNYIPSRKAVLIP
ncbi:hypothetical protein RZS08_23325, partial [Arthrospira platensis SPKY1]|nr:hypothetical protein [Arthrospira platensis SPKY1]